MKYIFLLLSLILLMQFDAISQSRNSFPQDSVTNNYGEMITSIINDTYDSKYDNALKETDKLIIAFPNDPVGYLYKSGVYWKMFEEGCYESKDSAKLQIKTLIDRACEVSRQRLDADPDDIMTNFYCAGSLVYRAGFEAMDHDWIAVMSDGLKAKKLLEKTIELDPNFYDAYSGLGAFNYYADRIPWFLKPIAFVLGVRGNEAGGIAQLKKAVQSGKYAKVEASVFLASVVYVNNGDYSNAAKLMNELHQQFPDNLDFVKNLCHDYYEQQMYFDVVRLANSALEMEDEKGPCHRNSLCLIRFYRGKSFEKLNEKNKAIADYEIVLEEDGDGYPGREAKAALEKLVH